MESNQPAGRQRVPWNKGKLVGQKAPFKPKDVWAMRARMEREHRTRELALFNLGIDSKLRGCDLVALKVRDIQHGAQIAPRAIITQHKTGRPVQFEITPPTRAAVQAWIVEAGLQVRRLPVPESHSRLAAHLHAAVRADAQGLGARCRARLDGLRHALNATNQGGVDLPEDEEPARRSAAAWPHQARLSPEPDYVPPHRPLRMSGAMQRWT